MVSPNRENEEEETFLDNTTANDSKNGAMKEEWGCWVMGWWVCEGSPNGNNNIGVGDENFSNDDGFIKGAKDGDGSSGVVNNSLDCFEWGAKISNMAVDANVYVHVVGRNCVMDKMDECDV